MPPHQNIIVLGGGRFPNGRLTDLSTQRLDASIKLFQKGCAESITVLGGAASTYLPGAIVFEKTGADLRAEYLVIKGVPASKIFKIPGGKDTIEEAIVCRDNLPSFGITSFILVTSTLHLPRASWLFEIILGPHYSMDFHGTPCGGLLLEEEEKAYLSTTQAYFSQHPDCLSDTVDWHERNAALYQKFQIIHDRLHPKGKESQAYCATLNTNQAPS